LLLLVLLVMVALLLLLLLVPLLFMVLLLKVLLQLLLLLLLRSSLIHRMDPHTTCLLRPWPLHLVCRHTGLYHLPMRQSNLLTSMLLYPCCAIDTCTALHGC
jgi:hypothetical protein